MNHQCLHLIKSVTKFILKLVQDEERGASVSNPDTSGVAEHFKRYPQRQLILFRPSLQLLFIPDSKTNTEYIITWMIGKHSPTLLVLVSSRYHYQVPKLVGRGNLSSNVFFIGLNQPGHKVGLSLNPGNLLGQGGSRWMRLIRIQTRFVVEHWLDMVGVHLALCTINK